MTVNLEDCLQMLDGLEPVRRTGRVVEAIGLLLESDGPQVAVGETCRVEGLAGGKSVLAEVVGFRGSRVLLMPLAEMHGVAPGATVAACGGTLQVPVGDELLGRVLDALGRPIDGRGPTRARATRSLRSAAPPPLERQRVLEPMATGIRAIDALVTCGKGQRVGIFAGSGVGKSVLLGSIARNCAADLNVIALVGERGREVRDFLERDLGPEGLARSIVVAATSDQPALLRIKSALLATTIAEHFRDQGRDVLLVMDSLTRVAMAQREIGLAVGEPPATKGYPPSVYALLPRLLERSGMARTGSITALYTVLVEGDDMNEPVADMARSILDGHIVLSRRLASEGHYPAIDVLGSVSRVMHEVVPPEHVRAASRLRELLATYREAEDLVHIGAYARGSSPRIDTALAKIDAMRTFLRQGAGETSPFIDTQRALAALVESGAP
jgi:flagellum-specific ATP synthase